MAKRKRGRVLVREVLAEMRAGASIMTGGSRCHTTYFFRDGSWWVEHFDEGHVEEAKTSEAVIRERIAGYPDKARAIIRQARWRPFSEAFLRGGDPTRALELLEESRRFGERFHHAEILEAFLRFPPRLDPKLKTLIRSELKGFTAYHTFMEGAGWDRSPETGRKGVLYVDRLIEMVGVCPGCFKVRASFHQQAEDHDAAVADLERELAQTKPGGWDHEYLTGLLATARARAAKAN
jgi:hypothetical protein